MTVSPPYYAVIFSSQRADRDKDYDETARRMETLAKTMPGFLGLEAARDEGGFGVTVSYWESEAAIAEWKRNAEHLEAQRRGRAEWYDSFTLRVAKVERAYGMNNSWQETKG